VVVLDIGLRLAEHVELDVDDISVSAQRRMWS
jgi:hypothetical protein